MAENGRAIVLDLLLALEQEEEYSHRLVRSVLDKYNYLDPREKAFIKRVAEGTLERRLELDYYLNCFSARVPVTKMRPLIRCLLRMSVYQLLYMDSVPDSAVCNEACRLAAKRGMGNLKGFVNGILRSISRKKDCLPLPDRERQPLSYASVRYSMPEWLVELWTGEYGREITETLLDGLMKVRPVTVRFAADVSEEEQKRLCGLMEDQGIAVIPGPYLPCVCYLENAPGLASLPGFAEGRFTVQDVSSALAVEAAGIGKDDFVVDVCGAPGGKSIYAAEKAGRVLSRDVSEAKTVLIEEAAERMRRHNMQIEIHDGTCPDEALKDKADVLLLDVPCSGLGVIGKKRDIKYRVTKEGTEALTKLQRQIVDASAGYVKPGGTLVYSTCTIHREENEAMAAHIVRELGFEPVSLEGRLPERLLKERQMISRDLERSGLRQDRGLTKEEAEACIQFLPGYMEADGFFLAVFRRPGAEGLSGLKGETNEKN